MLVVPFIMLVLVGFAFIFFLGIVTLVGWGIKKTINHSGRQYESHVDGYDYHEDDFDDDFETHERRPIFHDTKAVHPFGWGIAFVAATFVFGVVLFAGYSTKSHVSEPVAVQAVTPAPDSLSITPSPVLPQPVLANSSLSEAPQSTATDNPLNENKKKTKAASSETTPNKITPNKTMPSPAPKWVKKALDDDLEQEVRVYHDGTIIIASGRYVTKEEAKKDTRKIYLNWVRKRYQLAHSSIDTTGAVVDPEGDEISEQFLLNLSIGEDYFQSSTEEVLLGSTTTLYKRFHKINKFTEKELFVKVDVYYREKIEQNHREAIQRQSERRAIGAGGFLVVAMFLLGGTSFFIRRKNSIAHDTSKENTYSKENT